MGFFAGMASAQTPNGDEADRLFKEGKALMANGHPEQACAKFEESLSRERAGGTLLNLGECQASLGHFVAAGRSFAEARDLARDAGRDDARAFAAQRLADAEAHQAKLVIAAPASFSSDLSLKIDDVPTPIAPGETLNIPVDLGDHRIVLEGPDYQPWSTRIGLTAAGASVAIGLTEPVKLSRKSSPGPIREARAAAPAAAPLPSQRIAGWSLVGVGGLTGLVGAVFGSVAVALYSDGSARCPEVHCRDSKGIQQIDAAGIYADGATVMLSAGAVVAAVGTVLLLTAPRARRPPIRAADGVFLPLAF